MAATATMTIRVTPEQRSFITEAASMWDMSVSEYVRNVVLEHLEDEYDLREAEKAHAEYLRDPVTYSHEEIMERLGLS